MDELFSQALYERLILLDRDCRRMKLLDAINKNSGDSVASEILAIIDLFQGAAREIASAPYRSEERRDDKLKQLSEVQEFVLTSMASRASSSIGPILTDLYLERLKNIADQLNEMGLQPIKIIDRHAMMNATEELLKEIADWEIDQYAKDVLVIELNSIQRIIQASHRLSANDLRLRVKEIVADVAVEFKRMDRKHQTKFERVVDWARFVLGGSAFALGLVSQAGDIKSLIYDPIKQITKQD